MKLIFTHYLWLAAMCCLSLTSNAQGIKGKITDEKKETIPFATVYIQRTQTGTTANLQGNFSISLQPGTYKLVFRSLGYKQVVKEVVITEGVKELNVELPTEVYQIKELVVKKANEDPAYPIMRKAIAWAPYHLNQVSHYVSDVYLKGTLAIDKIPWYLRNKAGVSNGKHTVYIKTGDVFLDESVNEITFDTPHKYKLRVKSSRSSFPNVGNRAIAPIDLIQSSLYQPTLIEWISPLAPNAFAHYKFVYEGYFEEGDYIINKIRVEPKRKSQQVFQGHIYIVDKYWTIHSADLSAETFWGGVRVKPLYSPIKVGAWLPVTYNFQFTLSMLGVKGQYRYSSSVSYNDVKIDEKLTGPVIVTKSELAEEVKSNQKKSSANGEMEKLMSKDKLSNRDMRKILRATQKAQKQLHPDTVKSLEIKPNREFYKVDSGATKRDTVYWAQTRAIPLTMDELKSYQKKDSIQKVAEQDTAKTAGKKKKSRIVGKLIGGITWPSRDSSCWFHYSGLVNPKLLSFNTVDGWRYKQSFTFSKKLDSIHQIYVAPEVAYAFNRKALMGKIDFGYTYAPLRNGQLGLSAGSYSEDFNRNTGIKPFVNTISSLFFRENYMKLFDDKYINLRNSIDIANGLRWRVSLNYMEARSLDNHTDFSFFYRHQKDYSSNVPENAYFLGSWYNLYKSITFTTGLTYVPEFYYTIEKGRKRMMHSKYPTFGVNYTSGINGLLGSNASYQRVTGSINQRVRLSDWSTFSYRVEAGNYFNVKQIHFSEFKHFNTQPLPVSIDGFKESFQLLGFYKYSTSQRYLEGHAHYETQLLLLKYLPYISNTIWSENIYFNYLTTPLLTHYTEIGYGLGNIALMGELGGFVSFENGKYRSAGVRLCIGFGN